MPPNWNFVKCLEDVNEVSLSLDQLVLILVFEISEIEL